MNKNLKIVLTISGTIALLIVFYSAWQYLTSPIDPVNKIGNDSTDNQTVSTKLKKLTDENVFDFWVNKKTNELYYISDKGLISKVSDDQSNQTISSQNISNLSYVKPSVDGSLLLIALGLPQAPSFSVFNISKRSFQLLPKEATAADWDPQSNNRIIYLKNNGTSGSLALWDLQTGKSSDVIKMSQKDLNVDWALPEVVYLSDRPSDQNKGSVWSFNFKNKTLRTISSDELGIEIKWWSLKKIGLKLSNGILSLINYDGKQLNTIDLRTRPSKCFLDDPLIYCSAPINQGSLSKIPDFNLKNPSTNEELYLISITQTGNGSKLTASNWIYENDPEIPLNSHKIEKRDNALLILNQLDHKLYSLPL